MQTLLRTAVLWGRYLVGGVLAVALAGCSSSGRDDPADTGEDVGERMTDVAPSVPVPATVWKPAPGVTWQWQLSGALDLSLDVQMYDVDLFDTPEETITQLHADGRVVICYFSAGTHEDWRPDSDAFSPSIIGKELPEWKGERWLDVRSPDLRPILLTRLDMAVAKGCDGVEPDNVDGFDNDSGFDLTYDDQLAFNRWLADAAHERALSIGLKNDLSQILDLLPWFEWALNEECSAYHECAALRPFIDDGKAVFHTEYVDDQADGEEMLAQVCADPDRNGFSTLVKDWDLTPWLLTCP